MAGKPILNFSEKESTNSVPLNNLEVFQLLANAFVFYETWNWLKIINITVAIDCWAYSKGILFCTSIFPSKIKSTSLFEVLF